MDQLPRRSPKVKRWEGETRTIEAWDGLRRDSQLCYHDGDCFVHLYAKGHSQRGPSFRIPYRLLVESGCETLLDSCLIPVSPAGKPSSFSLGSNDPPDNTVNMVSREGKHELYIPAPDACSREDAFLYHITTRNFFAWLCGKSLVGNNFGKALVDLLERMKDYRPDKDNVQDVLDYAEKAGYMKFGNFPDYALSMLYLAEHCQLEELFTDAFAHCVGMNEILASSAEFEPISKVTKALITRAYLEMDLHIGRVSKALENFLEDDLSSSYLGLSQGARTHLDRFRSFLQAFYVEKYGYWPPPKESAYPKSLYRSMYFDFRNLYDFLVDIESNHSIKTQKPAVGGICVLQNIKAFNARHKYAPLPYPLPLVPSAATPGPRTQSQRAVLALRLGKQTTKHERANSIKNSLTAATNSEDDTVTSCPLVRAYIGFEREWSARQEEKVSVADARRVRWILIYGILQMLISVTRAPREVREPESVDYPLCCLLAGTPPWKAGIKSLKKPIAQSRSNIPEIPDYEHSSTPTFDIRPDCEMNDYFNINSRRGSNTSIEVTPALRIKSIRTPRRLSQTFSSSRSSSTRSDSTPPRNDSVRSSCYGTPVLGAASVRPIGNLKMPIAPIRTHSLQSHSPLRPHSFLLSDFEHGRNAATISPSLTTIADLDSAITDLNAGNSAKALPDIPKPLPSRPRSHSKDLALGISPRSDVQRIPILEHSPLELQEPDVSLRHLSSSPDHIGISSFSSPVESNSVSSNRDSNGSLASLLWTGEESNESDADAEDGPLPEMDHASLYSRSGSGIWKPRKILLAAGEDESGINSTPAAFRSRLSLDIPLHSKEASTGFSRRVSFSSPYPPSSARHFSPAHTPSRTPSKSSAPLRTDNMRKTDLVGTFWLEEPDVEFDATKEVGGVGGIGVAVGGEVNDHDEDDRPTTAWGVDMWGALEALNTTVAVR